MTQSEREKAIAELRARRAARGSADPLNRLSAAVAKAVSEGAEIVTERKESDQ